MIHQSIPIGKAVDHLLTIWGASEPEEWVNRTEWIPLK